MLCIKREFCQGSNPWAIATEAAPAMRAVVSPIAFHLRFDPAIVILLLAPHAIAASLHDMVMPCDSEIGRYPGMQEQIYLWRSEMTPLRKCMTRTQDVYIQAVRRLAARYMRSHDLLSEAEARAYLLHLRDERGIARGTFKADHG